MITCNRCGTTNPAGTAYCQRCGFALTNMGESGIHSGTGSRGGNQGQPALPAWLESLRSGMGEVPFTSDNQKNNSSGGLNNKPEQDSAPPSFHAANLIDEDSLPSWLRAEAEARGEAPAPTNRPDMSHALRPASYGAPNTDENVFEGRERGIAANSLVDEQSLPPWMRQEPGTASQGNQRNISASSLVQPDAVPDWMKNMQTPAASTTPSTPSTPSISPASPINAPATDPFQVPSPMPPQVGQGFSARDLIDPQSLPSWMGQQNGQEAGQKQLGQGETFSASSLLDQRSLPDWIREEEQPSAPVPPAAYTANTQASPSPQAAQQQGPQANAVWQGQQPPAPGSGNNSQMPAGPNHSISASSFIDMNSLPPWLRQNEGSSSAQQGLVQRGPQRPVPPRGESVRVPSRPRSEMAQSEGNEVAANVFASMLGVASTAPNFPQQAQSGVQGSYGPQGFQGAQSSMSPVGNPPPSQGMPYGNMGGMGGVQVQPPSGTMPQQPSSGYMQGGYQNQGNYPMGNATMMPSANMGGPQPAMQSFGPNQYPQNTGNMGNARNIGNSAMMGEQQPHAKPAKRGLFEAIRSWLSRS